MCLIRHMLSRRIKTLLRVPKEVIIHILLEQYMFICSTRFVMHYV